MGIWIFALVLALVLCVCAVAFLIRHFHKFKCIQRLATQHKALAWVISAAPLLLAAACALFEGVTVVLVLIHLMIIWAVCDLVGLLVNKARHTTLAQQPRYVAGGVAILLTAAYIGAGVFALYNVEETHYELSTEKAAHLRILQISDSHLGTTFDGEGFDAYLQRAQQCNPDVVVVTGDLIDDGSSWEDMQAAARALGAMTSTYGTYYVFGNHDKGMGDGRGYGGQQVIDELTRNGVVVLQDQLVPLGNNVVLMGRQDKSAQSRASMQQLMAGVDPNAYVVVLDHQPGDYAAQEKSGVDLVLSGHTHGGQMIPVGQFSEAVGINDATYGLQRRGTTDFIVNAGISDWEIKFKTGAISEYVVVDVN